MKRVRFLAGVAFMTSLALTSCMRDDTLVEQEQNNLLKISLSGEITQVYKTRANDAGFCDKDAVGIYVVDYDGSTAGKLLLEGNRANNIKHTFDENANKWNAEQDIYYKNSKTNIDVYGYYPFSSPDNINAYSFEVQKDQSKTAEYGKLGGYEMSDFLWGKAVNVIPTDNVINISFSHKMASTQVTLLEGKGFDNGEWDKLDKQVLLLNTTRKAAIDLSTGSVTAIGEAATTGTIPYCNGNDYRAIIVPQQVTAGKPLASITVNGTSYQFKKDEAFTYIPSKQHNFTITVNKRDVTGMYEFVLTSESITAWENDNISHDATAREYIVINVEEPGTLEKCITAAGKDMKSVRNLKVTGRITSKDFAIMKYKMNSLNALNLKEAAIIAGGSGNLDGNDGTIYYSCTDDEIPDYALNEKTTLVTLVLPDKLKYISKEKGNAFYNCTSLSGVLTIPEGVEEIGPTAFANCSSLSGTLTLPVTLKKLGTNKDSKVGVFSGCGFSGELILPESLKEIGAYCFSDCKNLNGGLSLPDGLSIIGEGAFSGCENLTGSLVIPQNITTIPDYCFYSCYTEGGTLFLNDNITTIGKFAFARTEMKGDLRLPKKLQVVNEGAFLYCGSLTSSYRSLKLPESLLSIGNNAFQDSKVGGTLEIPKKIVSIGAEAFKDDGFGKIILPAGLEFINEQAFNYSVNTVVCEGTTPPKVAKGSIGGYLLVVPESAIQRYKTAEGWSDFENISSHLFDIKPSSITALSTETYNLMLDADGEWIVESKPDWITLDKTSGTGKAELKLSFSDLPDSGTPMGCSGGIVFKLKDKDLRTSCSVNHLALNYQEDEIITLQEAQKGNGINIVFIGEGFTAVDLSSYDFKESQYMRDVNNAVESFFNIEPYKTYRDYFNVYTSIALSQENGIGGVNTIRNNRFNTMMYGDGTLGGRNRAEDAKKILQYACKAPTVDESNINETLIVMVLNTSDSESGTTYIYDDGTAISYCPRYYSWNKGQEWFIQHEAGGHGFGKLGDEYVYVNTFIDDCNCSYPHVGELNAAKAKGWYENISLSGKMNEVPWSHLISNNKYNQIVDIYEGGFFHSRGVYRSEQSSCMNGNSPYYNTISREAIVKRIKKIAGETYSFDDFVANDVIGVSANQTRSLSPEFTSKSARRHNAPIMMGKRPSLNN